MVEIIDDDDVGERTRVERGVGGEIAQRRVRARRRELEKRLWILLKDVQRSNDRRRLWGERPAEL